MPTQRDTGQSIHLLLLGATVGMVGGILMALFTMLATATYLQMGFFTPLYAIAAPLIGQQPLMTSLLQGGFYLALGPALLGLVVHLLWAALWGLIFGLLAHRLHLTGRLPIIARSAYGLLLILPLTLAPTPILPPPPPPPPL